MTRRSILSVILAGVVLLILALPVFAGGWAVVTLDSLPAAPRAGQSLHVGFMVRQHGQTPTNSVQPHLLARNPETGDQIDLSARQEGATGHFVVDVAFPAPGTWEWEIIPEPFAATQLAPLSVLPAVASSAPVSSAPAEPVTLRSTVRWVGLLALITAMGLALAAWRTARAAGTPG